MSAPTLLADLRTRGIHVDVDGDQLRARFRGRTLDPDLAAVIRANKPALIAYLREEEAAITWRAEAMQQQIPERGPVPFLVAVSGVEPGPNRCLSCGNSFELVGYVPRCRLCTVAATRALAETQEDIAQAAQPAAA